MNSNDDSKAELLARNGLLNRRSQSIEDELFERYVFFDSRDLLQVKYEMVRRVQQDGWTVTRAAKAYGFSRPAFYEVQNELEQGGLPALMPKRRGPKAPHKLSLEIIKFMEQIRTTDKSVKSSDLANLVADRFSIVVHPRSIERALAREKKRPDERKHSE